MDPLSNVFRYWQALGKIKAKEAGRELGDCLEWPGKCPLEHFLGRDYKHCWVND